VQSPIGCESGTRMTALSRLTPGALGGGCISMAGGSATPSVAWSDFGVSWTSDGCGRTPVDNEVPLATPAPAPASALVAEPAPAPGAADTAAFDTVAASSMSIASASLPEGHVSGSVAFSPG
jgi:hypothetical protein